MTQFFCDICGASIPTDEFDDREELYRGSGFMKDPRGYFGGDYIQAIVNGKGEVDGHRYESSIMTCEDCAAKIDEAIRETILAIRDVEEANHPNFSARKIRDFTRPLMTKLARADSAIQG